MDNILICFKYYIVDMVVITVGFCRQYDAQIWSKMAINVIDVVASIIIIYIGKDLVLKVLCIMNWSMFIIIT